MTGDEAANDDLVRRFLSAWERRDTEHIVAAFTEDAVYHSLPLRPITGKEALRVWVEGFTGVPSGRLEVRHQVVTGDVVMNERTDHITIRGAPVVLPICAVFEIEGGRIRAWREYFDLEGLKGAIEARRSAT